MNNKRTCMALLLCAVLASGNISNASDRYVNDTIINSFSGQNYSNIDVAGKRFEVPDNGQWGYYYDESTGTYKPLPKVFEKVTAGEGNYNLVNGEYVWVGYKEDGGEGGNYVISGQYGYGDLMPGEEETYGGGFENNGIIYYFNNNTFKNNKADFGGGFRRRIC